MPTHPSARFLQNRSVLIQCLPRKCFGGFQIVCVWMSLCSNLKFSKMLYRLFILVETSFNCSVSILAHISPANIKAAIITGFRQKLPHMASL